MITGAICRGTISGVQKRVLDKKALFLPCASHNLNLVIIDAAKSTVESVSFFGVLSSLYTIFRENSLSSAQTDARDIAKEMGKPMVFPTARI